MKSYLCMKCLTTSKVEDLKKDAKKRKGVIKSLRQCPVDKCSSVVFYNNVGENNE